MIEVYTTTTCPRCPAVKELLTRNGLCFTERSLVTEEQKNAFIDEFNIRTVPTVVVDGKVIGGIAEVTTWIGALDDHF